MSARTVPLDESGSAVINASGVAVVEIGPVARQRWLVENLGVLGASTASPEARVYRGAPVPSNYVAGTYDGNGDNAPLGVVLMPGQRLTVVWTGGTPGARVTASLYGTMTVGY